MLPSLYLSVVMDPSTKDYYAIINSQLSPEEILLDFFQMLLAQQNSQVDRNDFL